MSAALPRATQPSNVRDTLALMKPRVMWLAVFTGGVGFALAPTTPSPAIAIMALAMIALGAGASGALNMWYDADIDAKMQRTRTRPIPAGRVTREGALEFGALTACASVYGLGAMVSWAAAAWLAATIVFYAVVYTMWLKPRTSYNIVWGGLAGALPPVIGWAAAGGGWAAAGGGLAMPPAILCLIIFLWTPPHFWALALLQRDDYAAAGLPMLPVVAGVRRTQWEIWLYTLATAAAGCLPFVLGFGGIVSLAVAATSGVILIALATRLLLAGTAPAKWKGRARQMFFASIWYLFAVFASLLVESLWLA